MNTLARQCQVEDILLDVDIQNRQQLFRTVADHLARRHGLPSTDIYSRLEEREKLGSTALGQGVAIPHARINGIDSPLVVFVRTRLPIPFDAPDGKPVGSFFLLLVPAQANQAHLQLLADTASVLCERKVRDALHTATTALDIRRVLLDWTQS
ncbi:MAG: PTS sugar transporter subunit IIA [Burkholderiales bacterium]|nr:PTS sugar transporter subunit IIA [Burkholderiales bacterium]